MPLIICFLVFSFEASPPSLRPSRFRFCSLIDPHVSNSRSRRFRFWCVQVHSQGTGKGYRNSLDISDCAGSPINFKLVQRSTELSAIDVTVIAICERLVLVSEAGWRSVSIYAFVAHTPIAPSIPPSMPVLPTPPLTLEFFVDFHVFSLNFFSEVPAWKFCQHYYFGNLAISQYPQQGEQVSQQFSFVGASPLTRSWGNPGTVTISQHQFNKTEQHTQWG